MSIFPPYPFFVDDDGSPLNGGQIYIGEANLDPAANPKAVYWDEGLTIPAQQPIATNAGYPVRAGTPANFYTDGDYSIRVKDCRGVTIYTVPFAAGTSANTDPDDKKLSGLPVGSIIEWGGQNLPKGFLWCDGSQKSRFTYSALFAEIRTTWGFGDGVTTFNLPDARCRATIGLDMAVSGTFADRIPPTQFDTRVIGNFGGVSQVALAVAQMPQHNHTATASIPNHAHQWHASGSAGRAIDVTGGSEAQGSNLYNATGEAIPLPASHLTGPYYTTTQQTRDGNQNITVGLTSAGDGDPHTNIQPSIVVPKIIKAEDTEGHGQYIVGFFFASELEPGEVVFNHIVAAPILLNGNLSGSFLGGVTIAPSGDTVLRILKNGADVGTLTVEAAGTVSATTTGGLPVTLATGEILSVVGPVTPVTGDVLVTITFIGAR